MRTAVRVPEPFRGHQLDGAETRSPDVDVTIAVAVVGGGCSGDVGAESVEGEVFRRLCGVVMPWVGYLGTPEGVDGVERGRAGLVGEN